jgi:general secretion pathway protein G
MQGCVIYRLADDDLKSKSEHENSISGIVFTDNHYIQFAISNKQDSNMGLTYLRNLISGHRAARGFTLLELLVVLVILGLLVGIVAPRFFGQVGKSEIKVAKAQIRALEDGLDQYRLDTGRYPTSEQGLAALMAQPTGVARWQGPYLKKTVPNDPWGNPYQYRNPGEHGEFDLYSLGKDGQAGGTGEAEDIVNW